MQITLQSVGRRYNQEWIFRKVDYTFTFGKKYAVLGPNGSGKSTLLKVLSGSLSPSEGKIIYTGRDLTTQIEVETVYQQLSFTAPYVELIEEFTLQEMLDFHFKFKPYFPGFDKDSLIELMGLQKSKDKEIHYFSSGMKQRLKLVLGCCSDSKIVLLDEPTSNLDVEGEQWYLSLVERTSHPERLFIIGSNQEKEYVFCDEKLSILDYK
ncbi:ABC transporter ATP-binding protein [Sphingobacterium wenxiniae]|uniref:ABC-type multidrug transport system, ATPase component n=1 Tax=Sphingobacterium wenxiniae TaxID=683125 RepID=A0A1I6R7F5_9SPHI|nr:ATP-binding cassette domain-containing protein [Sphingobacterium wenxiniae]SFS60661.1 ABC-type multidrug transport system, ATPase component [Sphingobacterium wenxiniae]